MTDDAKAVSMVLLLPKLEPVSATDTLADTSSSRSPMSGLEASEFMFAAATASSMERKIVSMRGDVELNLEMGFADKI